MPTMRRPLRHPPVLVAAALLALVGMYMLMVPRDNWAGLLPSSSSTSTPNILPPLSGSQPPRELRDTLASLRANFTAEYARHSDSPPPEPVYAGPYLTAAQRKRYDHLRHPLASTAKDLAPKYMLTTITREITSQLPDLLNTIAVLAHFLGPERISLSILEGPSGDATPHILNHVLRPLLQHLGVPISAVRIETNAPAIDWGTVNRIEALAELRNQALNPLWEDVAPKSKSSVGKDVAAVVFMNDVFLRAMDVLELLHQHTLSKASITTAWDWMTRDPAYYYDVWVGRTIDTGDLFYPIPGNEWHPSDNLFSASLSSRDAFDHLRPFQVYSSWNALAVLSPEPFRPPFSVRFRRGDTQNGECAASECLLVCTDFWKAGFGRVQVVPAVQLAYGRDVALQTAVRLREDAKRLGWRNGVPQGDKGLKWKSDPPKKVRCNPWPEVTGLQANVWEKTTWLPPWVRS